MVTTIIAVLAAGAVQASPAIPMPAPADMLACVPERYRRTAVERVPLAQQRPIVACWIALAARAINARSPLRISRLETLESAAAVGGMLEYRYTVDVDVADVTDEIRATLDERSRAAICANVNLTRFMPAGASFAYVWRDRAHRPIHQVRIERC